MPRGALLAFAGRLRVSGVRGLGALRARKACTVAVQRLPHPDVADGGDDLRGHQAQSYGVVPRQCSTCTQNKQGISPPRAASTSALSTAWAMHHKLRQVMLERNQGKPLDGRIGMDDAYLGGERSGGKCGRGGLRRRSSPLSRPPGDGKAHRLKRRRVRRFTKKNIKKITGRIVTRGARVVTDRLGCFNGVADAGCTHEPITTVSGRKAARHPASKAIDTCSATSRAPSLPGFDPGARSTPSLSSNTGPTAAMILPP
jgi:ISXO2-like transposase domain